MIKVQLKAISMKWTEKEINLFNIKHKKKNRICFKVRIRAISRKGRRKINNAAYVFTRENYEVVGTNDNEEETSGWLRDVKSVFAISY